MKGFGRLRDRGPLPLQEGRSHFERVSVAAAAAPQVANAFHVASEK